LANQEVDLVDLSGETVGTATTDSRGVFRFDISNGLGVGQFTLRVELPNGWTQTTRLSVISITRGDTFVMRDLGVANSGQTVSGRAASASEGDGSSIDPLNELLNGTDLTTLSVPLPRRFGTQPRR
jgi:hypothetical protein